MKEKQFIRCFIIIISCWLLTFGLYAVNDLHFRNITVEQGLTSNTINCIFKDNKKFIWLGTANGLNRFDGFNVLSFDPFNNKSIVAISEPDSIHLYVSSERELFRYNRKERRSTQLTIQSTANLTIKTFHLDSNKNLYIITSDGLYILATNTNQATKVANEKIKNKSLTDIYIDHKDVCWITSNNGLIRYDLDSQSIGIYNMAATDNRYLCLTKNDTNIFVANQRNEIYTFDAKSNNLSLFTSLKNDPIINMSLYDNKLYVATNGGGLKIIDLNSKSVSVLKYDSANPLSPGGLSANAIYSVLIDESAFWIGTFSGGLNYVSFRRDIFKVFNDSEVNTYGLNVRSFYLHNNARVIGTRNGLIYSLGKIQKKFTTENAPELKSNIILSIQPYGQDYLIGTFGGGIKVLDTRTLTIKPFRSESEFNENSFYSILKDDEGLVWFGTLTGLIKYNTKDNTYNIYNTENSGLIKNDIYSIWKDSQGRIWIATREGICYYEKGKIQRPERIDLSFVSVVRQVYEDQEQNIWLACENEGVVKINKDLTSYQNFTTNNFLPDNHISSIIEGQPGYIWIATAKGIVCYNTKTLDYHIFSMKDGIPSLTFNDGAVQKTENGTIWWGNEKGFIFLNNPENLNTRQSQTNISITGIFINGIIEDATIKNLPMAPEYLTSIALPSSQSGSFAVRFSDFEYDYPPANIYEYKIEGISKAWSREIGRNEILIPTYPTGTFKLLIRKAGSEEPIKAITIIKKKSYTIYIWIIVFIIILASFIFIYKRLLAKYHIQRHLTNKIGSLSKIKYPNIKIEKDELENIKKALTEYMENKKPYLNPNLKLDDIANAIQYPKTKISQVLNQYLDTNYANFVAKYRIEMFKEKAEEGLLHRYTLSALAKECGFSSRSSFFQSMKKLTGQTPLEYLKEKGIE